MKSLILPEKNFVDLSIYQNDPELIPIVRMAKEKYDEFVLVFPNTPKDVFFLAYLAGYEKGVIAGVEAFKSLNVEMADKK